MNNKDLERLERFWGNRTFMTKAELIDEVLVHPDIPGKVCDDIFTCISRGLTAIDFQDFVAAIQLLEEDGWPGNISLATLSRESHQLSIDSENSFSEVISGVTHFDIDEIAVLERLFSQKCDRQTWRMTETTFVSILLPEVKRVDIIERVFHLFNGHADGTIGIKEYVCGLSSIWKGPDAERLKFMVRIWDSDFDELLTISDLESMFDYFELDHHQLPSDQLNNFSQVSILGFICFAIDNQILREKLIEFSCKVALALTTNSVNYCENNGERQMQNGIAKWSPEKRMEPIKPLAGVKNIGNTCYISAAIQTLANVNPLTGFFLNNEQQFSPQMAIVQNYVCMLRTLCVQKETTSPSALKESISKKNAIFADNFQHDCQEFLLFLLDALHEDLTKFTEYKREDAPTQTNELEKGMWTGAAQHWEREKQRSSMVQLLFAGQLLSRLSCMNCGHSSSNFELFTMLQLQIPIVNQIVLVIIKVFQRNSASVRRYALPVAASTRLCDLKKLICEKTGLQCGTTLVLFVNKSNGKNSSNLSQIINAEENGQSEDGDRRIGAIKEIPLADFDICCFEKGAECEKEMICIHRRIYNRHDEYAARQMDGIAVSTFCLPIVLFFNPEQKSITGQQLFDLVWKCVSSRYPSNGTANRAVDANVDYQSRSPFELSFTEADGVWCNRCGWNTFCRGCAIGEDDQFEMESVLGRDCVLTINWSIAALYLRFNGLAEHYEDDPSVQESDRWESRAVSIYDCLDDFTREEAIEDSDCKKCKSAVDRRKKLSLVRVPEFLIVYFKRFLFVPSLGRYVKQLTPVKFPLDQFDPSLYFADVPPELKEGHSNYKCIGVIIHQGQLNYGHYTSYVRSLFSDGWLFCNDHLIHPVREADMDLRNAYILFFQRSDGEATEKSAQ